MFTESNSNSTPDSLIKVKEQFAAWRNGLKQSRKIPEDLRQAAVDLSKEYPINHICKALCLSYTDLKKRVKKQSKENFPAVKTRPHMNFIELGIESRPAAPECIVEIEDGSGAKMTIHLRGQTDLDLYELGRTFWSKRS
jgi:hypothetical protein